jgi:hypothetical protein
MRAGLTRFRPVVLTAVTTVLGLFPLAVGFNFDFVGLFTSLSPNIYWGGEQAAWWGPMAIAVIAGLTFATLLTLVMVPVLYSVLEDVGLAFQRVFTSAAADQPSAEPVPSAEGRNAARPRRPRRLAAVLARFQKETPAGA